MEVSESKEQCFEDLNYVIIDNGTLPSLRKQVMEHAPTKETTHWNPALKEASSFLCINVAN